MTVPSSKIETLRTEGVAPRTSQSPTCTQQLLKRPSEPLHCTVVQLLEQVAEPLSCYMLSCARRWSGMGSVPGACRAHLK